MQQVVQFSRPDARHLSTHTVHESQSLFLISPGRPLIPPPLVVALPCPPNYSAQRCYCFSRPTSLDSLKGFVPKFFLMSIPVFSLATSSKASYTSTFVVAS